jgi:hypothetical protein
LRAPSAHRKKRPSLSPRQPTRTFSRASSRIFFLPCVLYPLHQQEICYPPKEKIAKPKGLTFSVSNLLSSSVGPPRATYQIKNSGNRRFTPHSGLSVRAPLSPLLSHRLACQNHQQPPAAIRNASTLGISSHVPLDLVVSALAPPALSARTLAAWRACMTSVFVQTIASSSVTPLRAPHSPFLPLSRSALLLNPLPPSLHH